MIARFETNSDAFRHVDRPQLEALLDETLPGSQVDTVQAHLDQCNTCRSQLDALAGTMQWWSETKEVLSEAATDTDRVPEQNDASENYSASLSWIGPLMEPCEIGRLGRFDGHPVDAIIGQGGMGVVLRGRDRQLGRDIAIKVLAPHLAGVGAARARFVREARAAAAIVHPSVVPIYGIETESSLPSIVMPCIEGGNLQERLDREGPLQLEEVLRIGLQVAEGLAAAHLFGVIHRDIKPANILMERGNGRALISDFGLARTLDDGAMTLSGLIAGTPQYMSPEQARGDKLDTRSDLFSLGSLLYVLATGRPPYRGDGPLAVMRKITDTTPRSVCDIQEQLPDWFDRLIQHFMQRALDKRPASADVAAELLRQSLAHVNNPSQNALPSSLQRSPLEAVLASHSTTAKSVSIGLTCLALVVGMGFILTSNQSQLPRSVPTQRMTDQPDPGNGAKRLSTGTDPRTPAMLPNSWDGQSFDNIADQLQQDIQAEIDMLRTDPSPTPFLTSPRFDGAQ